MNLCLGKLPAKKDKRNFKLSKLLILSNLPPLLLTYDIDIILAIIDTAVYLNDQLGDCVVAGSAHAIQRFEKFECGAQPNLSDTDIRAQYFKETGGPDEGLVLLDHLNLWRKDGLDFGKNFKIYAFALINWKNHKEVSYAIQLLRGAYLGFQVPKFFIDGFEAGKRTFDVQCRNTKIEGGHCVYACAFNKTGPIIVTWGARVQLTWKFWDKYVDECYAVLDAVDPWMDTLNNPLNIPLLKSYLASIAAGC
jgi:hypothetical protein